MQSRSHEMILTYLIITRWQSSAMNTIEHFLLKERKELSTNTNIVCILALDHLSKLGYLGFAAVSV